MQKPSLEIRSDNSIRLELLLLIFLTLLVFIRVQSFDFTNFDDDTFLLQNRFVIQGLSWEGIKWIFSGHFLLGSGHANYWAPAAFFSHMLDFQLFELNASGHHLTNLFLHILNTILLFFLLKKIPGLSSLRFWLALIFAIHPIQTESVCWIIERKGLLSTTFVFFSLHAYFAYCETRSIKFFLLSVLSYTAGLMAKVSIVPFPILLLLLDYWPLNRAHGKGRRWISLLIEKTPFIILSALSCIQTLIYMKGAGNTLDLEQLSLLQRVSNIAYAFFGYISKFFLPVNLTVYYPLPLHPLPFYQILLIYFLLLSITGFALYKRKEMPSLLVGWAWFVISLLPVIGIVQAGRQVMADRYIYLPLFGLLFIVGYLLQKVKRMDIHFPLPARILLFLLLGLLGGITFHQTQYWKNGETLFRHTVARTENNWLAHVNLASALIENHKVEEGKSNLEEALKINPHSEHVYYNFGVIYSMENQLDKASEYFQKALDQNLNSSRAYYELGRLSLEKGNTNAALNYLNAACRIDPVTTDFYFVGNVLRKSGNIDEAIACYQEALKNNPSLFEAHCYLASLYQKKGDIQKAISHYENALKINPDFLDALYNLGNIYQSQSESDKAIECYQNLLQRYPHYVKAMNNLGISLVRIGKIQEAMNCYQTSIQMNPNYLEPYYNAGIACLKVNDLKQGALFFSKALQINPDYKLARDAMDKLQKLKLLK